ncbi:hypothetical protein ACFYST_07565 [Kitasatospora sp. NPDC004614]|uniref:hypothetical protein n=1 Tax=unclassified Kitasatospora TaxID=2633591 RepID=UPI0036B4576E
MSESTDPQPSPAHAGKETAREEQSNAIFGGMIGPGGAQMMFTSDQRVSFEIKNLSGDYNFHVDARLNRYGDAEITAIGVSLKPDADLTGIQNSTQLPIALARHQAEVMLNSPWSAESVISIMVTQDTELPTQGRRSAPDRLLKVAWLHRHAERTNKTPGSVIRRHFGITNKVTVSKWVAECREKGYLPPRTKNVKAAETTRPTDSATTTDQLEEAIVRNRLDMLAIRGGDVGELAAALRQELDAAATEPHAQVEFNRKELHPLIPELEIPEPPERTALLLLIDACKSYQTTFNRLAVSHRNRPPVEIAVLLAEAAARCRLIFTYEAIAEQAITIRERRTARFRIAPDQLPTVAFAPTVAEWDPAPRLDDADTYGNVECSCGCEG